MMNEMKSVTAPKTVPISDEAFGKSNKTTIYWLGCAGFLINARGTIIMIDPILKAKQGQPGISEIEDIDDEIEYKLKVDLPIEADKVPKLDALLFTHSDPDHVAMGTVKDLIRLSPRIVGPPPVYEMLTKNGVDPKIIDMCRWREKFTVNSVTIEVTPADHPWQLLDIEKFGTPFRMGDCCGFKVITPDGTFYLPGDTRLIEELLSIKDVDVLAVDSSVDTFHLNHYGSAALANYLKDALLIPYHYGTYDVSGHPAHTGDTYPGHPAHCGDPKDMLTNVINRESRVRNLGPGQPLSLQEGVEVK